MTNEITETNSLAAYAANLNAKLQVCDMLVKSGVLPPSLKSAQAVLAVILKGQELGFPPIQACESFDFIQGRVAPRAAAIQAVCIKHGGRFTVIEETDQTVTIKAERPDRKWEQVFSFTWKDAERAGLTGKTNWKSWPKDMLYARCVSRLCRRGWADILGGLISIEEVADGFDAKEVAEEERKAAIEAEQPKQKTWSYDLQLLAEKHPESIEKAKQLLLGAGAELSTDGFWNSPRPIKNLLKYEVNSEQRV